MLCKVLETVRTMGKVVRSHDPDMSLFLVQMGLLGSDQPINMWVDSDVVGREEGIAKAAKRGFDIRKLSGRVALRTGFIKGKVGGDKSPPEVDR